MSDAAAVGPAPPAGSLVGTAGAILRLLSAEMRRRWLLLVALGAINAVLEMLGAVAILALINVVARPDEVAHTFGVRQLRDALAGVSEPTFVAVLSAMVAGFYLVKNSSQLFEAYLQAELANRAAATVSQQLVEGYLEMPWEQVMGRSSSELIRNVTFSADLAFRSVLPAALALVSDTFVITGMLIVLIVSAPLVTPVAGLSLGLMVWGLYRLLNGRLRRWGERSQDLSQVTLQAVQESLGGMKELRILGRQDYFISRYSIARTELAAVFQRSATALQVPRLSLETMFVGLMVLLVSLVVAFTGSTERVVPLIGLYAYAGFRLLPSLGRMTNSVNNIRFGSSAVDVMTADLAIVTARRSQPRQPARTPLPFVSELALEGVCYRFPGTEHDVLRGIDLVVAQGETVGIVGATGAGKSTLIDVVAGLLTPTAGAVAIDGVALRGNEAAWQRNLGYVPQSAFMIDDTLRRNIAFGVADDEVDEARVEEAVRVARLEDVVAELPEGLDSLVGERGTRFSGGQRQRVSIARALYHRPALLIFDEATSALDNRTEREIASALVGLAPRHTLLVVAHRTTSVELCDRVVFLNHGAVAAIAPFDELVRTNADFRRLVAQGSDPE
jgi:ABC-type multidrug transport system fused ATPase/permease subunit